ncbi:hypothetical protein Syun_008706 [Stephania yunnanensis]|uniref:Uncharacterized protein n=1 Tax=Stephania yunnanensis TaxID=152371 RepID=A0AAP0PNE0_9MAGN
MNLLVNGCPLPHIQRSLSLRVFSSHIVGGDSCRNRVFMNNINHVYINLNSIIHQRRR